MKDRLREFAGKFIDLRSPQEITEAVDQVENELRELASRYLTGQISLQEYQDSLDVHYKNPDARLDFRKLGAEFDAARARAVREDFVRKVKSGFRDLLHRGSQAS